jgi:hypothetical protein
MFHDLRPGISKPQIGRSRISPSEYHLTEYKNLTSTIEFLLKEIQISERLAIAGSIGFYAWLAVHQQGIIQIRDHTFVWWIPIMIPLMGIVRTYGNFYRVSQIASYIKNLEKKFLLLSEVKGWEAYLAEKRYGSMRSYLRPLVSMTIWALLLLANITIGALGSGLFIFQRDGGDIHFLLSL